MKTVVIGDIHGRNIWKKVIQHEKPDRVIFVGDYFDSFDISAADQIYNFQEIVLYQNETDIEVIMLLGNHDHHYLIMGETYSGYQPRMRWNIESTLRRNLDNMQIAYQLDNLLLSHAGISSIWCDNVFEDWSPETIVNQVNELYQFQPYKFNFTGSNPYGDSIDAGPLWIRPKSLMKSNKKGELKPKFVQIYGHTADTKICEKHFIKATGSKYLCIDALEEGWYVTYENQKLHIKQLIDD